MAHNIEGARIGRESDQATLFPVGNYAAPAAQTHAVCRRLGLSAFAAEKLHEGGWLSFDPREPRSLTPAENAELEFVGSLVGGGCDDRMLHRLLSGLQKPYAYRLSRVLYDWSEASWRLRDDPGRIEDNVEDWIDELVAWHELDTLKRLRGAVESAIARLLNRPAQAAARSGQLEDS